MKHFYYVEEQVQSTSPIEENDWKLIKVYRIETNELILIIDFKIELSEDSEESIDEILYDESYISIGEQDVKLIKL